jgi:hypothetical protein
MSPGNCRWSFRQPTPPRSRFSEAGIADWPVPVKNGAARRDPTTQEKNKGIRALWFVFRRLMHTFVGES